MISLIPVIWVFFSIEAISAQEMWGSRIITKSSGAVKEMKFDFQVQNVFGVIEKDETLVLTMDGKCQVKDQYIGEPCSYTESTATVSLDNVEKYKAFMINTSSDDMIPTVAAFMVPDCDFEETLKGKLRFIQAKYLHNLGKVDLKTSAPLTRFVKGQQEVELDFGLRPGDEDFQSELYRNGKKVCSWMGKTVDAKDQKLCKDLETSADGKLLVTRLTFEKKEQITKDNFYWKTPSSFVTVSVDWEKTGFAPEVAECESKGVTLIPTTTVSTTSSGPKSQECHLIIAGTLAIFAFAKFF